MMNSKNRGLEVTASSSQIISPASFNSRTALILLCTWIAAMLYLGFYLKRGWVPHDEGTYAQSAERVLQGELPHRDFDEGYTGGLTFVNALIFRTLGENLYSLRVALFVAFAIWVPCVFYIASQFIPLYLASAVTLMCALWSVPNYPVPSPSWYNLFFATFGVYTLFRYVRSGSRWLLVAAGLLTGISILAKITGMYFVAAVILFLVFREQEQKNGEDIGNSRNSGWWYRAFVIAGLTIFLTLLWRLVTSISGPGRVFYFVVPAVVLVAALLLNEFKRGPGRAISRFRTLLSMAGPFATGLAIPLLFFLAPFARVHALPAVFHGLFENSEKQLRFAASADPSPVMMIAMFPILLLVMMARYSHARGRRVYGTLLLLYLAAVLIFASGNLLAYAQGWCSLSSSIPVVTVAGAAVLGVPRFFTQLPEAKREPIFLLTSVMALLNLVQFPFTVPIYFCYIAPVVILTIAALVSAIKPPQTFAAYALTVFYIVFAALVLAPGCNLATFLPHPLKIKTERLAAERAGGLRVHQDEAEVYNTLIPLIQSHAGSQYIYAAPDCPEVYFLSGLKNPTRTFFDYREDPVGHTERVLLALKDHDVKLVAIDNDAQFSGTIRPDLRVALNNLYPNVEEVDHFEVRWR